MLNWMQRGWMGAAGGALASSVWGDPNEDLGDRAQKGALLGGVAGIGVPIALRYGAKPAFEGGASLAGRYGRSMRSQFSTLQAEGKGVLTAGFRSFGRLPVMMGAGAALGAALDSDDRGRGALIGAGAGAAVRLGYHGYRAWGAINKPIGAIGKFKGVRPGRFGLLAGLSAVAWAAGSSLTANQPTAQAVPMADGGYAEQAPGSPLPSAFENNQMLDAWGRESGLKDRLTNMNASGNIVFGAHHRRRR